MGKKTRTKEQYLLDDFKISYNELDKEEKEFVDKHTQGEIKDYFDKKAALTILKDKTEEEAKEYIKGNIYARALKKGFIAAYIETYHKNDDNSKMLNKCFKAKQKKIVVVDNNGNVVYNTKTGKPKTKFVKNESSDEKSFDKTAAIDAFAKAYDIKYKPTGFTAKEKRIEAIYDVFEGLM